MPQRVLKVVIFIWVIFICHTNEFCGMFEIIHSERRNLASRVSVDVLFFSVYKDRHPFFFYNL